ncbi:MAG: hypothetical protein QOI41_1171 [Myxococcales bacterium]|nr:hypothetical protein [Myxococcales bacterium]
MRGLERGRIAFVVRPRVERAPGLQRFMFLLSPDRGDVHRRIVVGKKRMPEPGANEREWAYVDKLGASRAELLADLGPSTYTTKTRGVRHQPGACIIGTGHYAILEHAEHAHLTYALDPGSERDQLHDAVNVAREGSVIAAVFNPVAKWSRQATLDYGGDPDDPSPFTEPSLFPEELQARFGDLRFLPLDPIFLDYEGAELVLIGAEDEVRPELAVAV